MRKNLRLGTKADFEAVARLFGELGVPDPTPSAAAFEALMLPRVIVAEAHDERGARVIGYAAWRCYGDTMHVVHVVVDPAARGQRVGLALMEALRGVARVQRCRRWFLNVKRDNDAALALYRRAGMEIVRPVWALSFAWSALPRLSGERCAGFAPEGTGDELLAERAAIEIERLQQMRAQGRVMVALGSEAEPVGLAVFDPRYPGAYPLWVARPTLLRPLLEALEPHREAALGDLVRLTVEREEGAVEALVEAGAKVDFALWRMGAELG